MSDTGLPTPVQDLPENQDPDVAYIIDQMTGEKSPLPGGPLDAREKGSEVAYAELAKDPETPKKRGGRPKKATAAREVGTDVVVPEAVEKADED